MLRGGRRRLAVWAASAVASSPLKPLSSLGKLQPAPDAGTPGPRCCRSPMRRRSHHPGQCQGGRSPWTASSARATSALRLHVHTHLTLFVDGKARRLPAGIGVWPPLPAKSVEVGPVLRHAEVLLLVALDALRRRAHPHRGARRPLVRASASSSTSGSTAQARTPRRARARARDGDRERQGLDGRSPPHPARVARPDSARGRAPARRAPDRRVAGNLLARRAGSPHAVEDDGDIAPPGVACVHLVRAEDRWTRREWAHRLA